jgi:phosphatidylinositol dimannoside acyltransferase
MVEFILMNLQRILNSQNAGIWALRISRLLPPSFGLKFSLFIADRIAENRQLPLVRAIRANRWVVSGGQLSGAELDLAVRENLRQIARSYYTLFHFIDDPLGLQNQVNFTPSIDALIARSQENTQGVVVAGLHQSNFDLVLQAAAWRGLRGTALSLPEDNENKTAIEWQHGFRRHSGIQIIPGSMQSLRDAIKRLQAGEMVMTGIDRPVGSAKYYPVFFGRPAHVPIHHIYLALAAKVPVMVFTAIQRSDGIYELFSSEEIELKSNQNHQIELISNAERVLEVAESFIRRAPGQWSITLPAWPEVLVELS